MFLCCGPPYTKVICHKCMQLTRYMCLLKKSAVLLFWHEYLFNSVHIWSVWFYSSNGTTTRKNCTHDKVKILKLSYVCCEWKFIVCVFRLRPLWFTNNNNFRFSLEPLSLEMNKQIKQPYQTFDIETGTSVWQVIYRN